MKELKRKELVAARETTINKMDELHTKYVPAFGTAETVLGELVRAWMRLAYRLYNDGDIPFSGYGRESCAPCMKYLIKTVPDIDFPKYSYKTGKNKLTDYATYLLMYFDEHPELETTKNTGNAMNILN